MTNFRVLVVHSYYKQRGGEDSVFEAEADLLEKSGWDVSRLAGNNSALDGLSKTSTAVKTIWNKDWAQEVAKRIEQFKPEIVHFHNTFPLLSPLVIREAKRFNLPVVQSLHNYRLGCLNGVLFRDGHLCTECMGNSPLPGIRHGCYRGKAASLVAASSMQVHRSLHTYDRGVDRFIVLTDAAKEIYVKMGIAPEKLATKPNFLDTPPTTGSGEGGYAMFIGRLSDEKGLGVLLEAWREGVGLPPLKIVGDGPLFDEVKGLARQSNVEVLGSLPHNEATELLGKASCLIMPSSWYEPCGLVLVEALACGTPVVASDFPTIRENLGGAGFLFTPGDPISLRNSVLKCLQHSDRISGRLQYEKRFTAQSCLNRLSEIYSEATEAHGQRSKPKM